MCRRCPRLTAIGPTAALSSQSTTRLRHSQHTACRADGHHTSRNSRSRRRPCASRRIARFGLTPEMSPKSVKSLLREGRRSFPSGHASVSMSTAVACALCLRRPIRDLVHIPSLRALILGCVLLFGWWIGATRIRDYRHHYIDVATGWGIGTFWAAFSHVIHYYVGNGFLSPTDAAAATAVRTMLPWESLRPLRRRSMTPSADIHAVSHLERNRDHDHPVVHALPYGGGIDLDGHPKVLRMRYLTCCPEAVAEEAADPFSSSIGIPAPWSRGPS